MKINTKTFLEILIKGAKMLLLIFLLLSSDIALAKSDCSGSFSIEIWVVVIWAFLKPISWCLGFIAEKTENKWDNKLSLFVSKLVSHLGWILGNLGIGNVPDTIKHRPKLPFK